jgi:hypothetical protein
MFARLNYLERLRPLATQPLMFCHRIIAALLLMAYAVTGTSLIPGAVAALADLEGSHQGLISIGRGETRVILHHTSEFTPEVGDHQHCLARFIVRFCQTDQSGDHQMTSTGIVGRYGEKRPEAGKVRSVHELTNLPATDAWRSLQPDSQTAFHRERICWQQPQLSQLPPSVMTVRLLV